MRFGSFLRRHQKSTTIFYQIADDLVFFLFHSMCRSTIIMIHAETQQKNHMKKHFADGQLTTATKPQYRLYTHIHHLHEILLVFVQRISKTKYVVTYVTILFLHFHTFFSQNIFHHFKRVLISCDQLFSHITLI